MAAVVSCVFQVYSSHHAPVAAVCSETVRGPVGCKGIRLSFGSHLGSVESEYARRQLSGRRGGVL